MREIKEKIQKSIAYLELFDPLVEEVKIPNLGQSDAQSLESNLKASGDVLLRKEVGVNIESDGKLTNSYTLILRRKD